jgi:hypothetical protein
MVRGKGGKPVVLDVTSRHSALGRTAPSRDKPLSRNDKRFYVAGKTPAKSWPFSAQGSFNLHKAR